MSIDPVTLAVVAVCRIIGFVYDVFTYVPFIYFAVKKQNRDQSKQVSVAFSSRPPNYGRSFAYISRNLVKNYR